MAPRPGCSRSSRASACPDQEWRQHEDGVQVASEPRLQRLPVPPHSSPMITRDEAARLVDEALEGMSRRSEVELVPNVAETRDEGWCWLFYYNSRAYLETGDTSEALAGNGPIAVEKQTGRLHHLGTAEPTDVQLHRLRESH